MHLKRKFQAVFAIVGFIAMGLASAQSVWPGNKPVMLINPFPPGGAVDGFGRPLAQALGEKIGTSVIVDNRGGAGGTIGAASAAKAAPDGYTWFLGAVHHAIAPSIYTKLSYDFERDFEPVALISDVPHVIVVNPKRVPEPTLQALLERIQKNPGKLDYASTGTGTSQHLAGELFKSRTKANIAHVPYRGTGPALQDLVAGHVDLMFDTLAGSANFIKSGQLKPLAIASAKRVAGFESVPTTAEAGVSDYVVSSWYALFAVKGTPPELIERMANEVNMILAEPGMIARWATMGATTRKLSPKELGAFVSSETKRWADVVKTANVKVE